MDRSNIEIIDLCAELQDDVIDSQREWLESLPVSSEVRMEIFERMCAVTGMLLDKLLALGKLEVE